MQAVIAEAHQRGDSNTGRQRKPIRAHGPDRGQFPAVTSGSDHGPQKIRTLFLALGEL